MKAEDIKQRLHKYIDEANSDQLKEMLSFVEEEETEYGVETASAPWDDEEFVKEMDRRMEELDSGKVKGIPWEDVHRKALENLDKMNRKDD